MHRTIGIFRKKKEMDKQDYAQVAALVHPFSQTKERKVEGNNRHLLLCQLTSQMSRRFFNHLPKNKNKM